MKLLRPELCLGVAVLLSFLSLTFLLLSSAPNTPSREAGWAAHPVLHSGREAPVGQAEERLDAMERRIQEMRYSAYPQYPQYPPPFPSALASQGQMDGLVQQLSDVLARASRQAPAPSPPAVEKDWGGWGVPSTTTPEWQGQLKELREAVERLSHQTDDRFSSLMKPGRGDGPPGSKAPGHACRSPPCSRDEKSCRVNGNCCSDLMFEMLVDFSDFLRRHNVTFMVSEGTLLGAVRDQDIIPYTADLDIFVPREGWEKAMLINEEEPKAKSYHFMVDPDQPHCARLCAVWEGFPVNRAPFDEHFEWDTEKVGNDLAYYMDIYDEEMDFAQATAHLIYPPSTVRIRNQSFPAPREQEIYVEARYGPSWRVPDHQARELAEKYPTLEEAKVWSANMLLLRSARSEAQLGYRMLERATVDFKTGDIVIRGGANQEAPHSNARKIQLEGFQMSDARAVQGGRVFVTPPEEGEEQIVDYVMYWAKEEVSWSDDILLKRIDSGMDSLDDVKKEVKDEGMWDSFREVTRPLGRIWRCKGAADPFKACAMRGAVLQVTIPLGIQVPEDATHLAATAENEAGENSGLVAARLDDLEEPEDGDDFTRKLLLGLLSGFFPRGRPRCGAGKQKLDKEGWEQIMAHMVLRTPAGMKEALSMLADWLQPVLAALEACGAGAKHRIGAAVERLRSENVEYQPGQALSVDGVSIFANVNGAIGSFRRDSFAPFGRDLGGLLQQLEPPEPSESSSSRAGLKLRGSEREPEPDAAD